MLPLACGARGSAGPVIQPLTLDSARPLTQPLTSLDSARRAVAWYSLKWTGSFSDGSGHTASGSITAALSGLWITISCAASSTSSSYQCASFSVESPAVAGGAIMYLAALFGLIATVITTAAAARLRHLAIKGVMPPSPGSPSDCGCYPSVPAMNGMGECGRVGTQGGGDASTGRCLSP
jgi:hypothetical protein